MYVGLEKAAERRGADFFIMVSPEKISVYPELRPLYIIPSKEPYTKPLLKSLAAAGVRVVDPTSVMQAFKGPEEALYYRTDTHWNLLGGLVCFELFRTMYPLPELPPFTLASLPPRRGDLVDAAGYTSFPLHNGDNFEPRFNPPLNIKETGGVYFNLNSPSEKTVWLFADSSNYSIRTYFMAMFHEVRIFRHSDYEKMMGSSGPGPDLVIWLTVERSFG
jgi:hypothetical protein